MQQYCTPREARLLRNLQAALGRVAGGGVLGAAGGSAVHAAVSYGTSLGSAAFANVDPFLNLVDVFIGGSAGLVLGGLWACDAALVRSGLLKAYIQGAVAALVSSTEDDAHAGELALRTIRDGFATLARRGDWPLRLAFLLTGLDQEPAVARMIDEAYATNRGAAARPMSELIGLSFEAMLNVRLGEARLLILVLALLAGGGVDGVAWALGVGLNQLFVS